MELCRKGRVKPNKKQSKWKGKVQEKGTVGDVIPDPGAPDPGKFQSDSLDKWEGLQILTKWFENSASGHKVACVTPFSRPAMIFLRDLLLTSPGLALFKVRLINQSTKTRKCGLAPRSSPIHS